MKYGVYAAMASAALYVAHSFFGGAGQKDHFSVSAKGGWTESASFQANVHLLLTGIVFRTAFCGTPPFHGTCPGFPKFLVCQFWGSLRL